MTIARALWLFARGGALAVLAAGAPLRAAGPSFDLADAVQAERNPLFQWAGPDEAETRRQMIAAGNRGVAWAPRITAGRHARSLSTWYRPRYFTTRGAAVTVLNRRLVLSGFTLSRNRISVAIYTTF